MHEKLAELIALDVLSAGGTAERRQVLAKWRTGAGKYGRADVIEETLPSVVRRLTAMLETEADAVQRRRILAAIGHVQDRLTR